MNATKSAIQTRIEPCESWGKYVLEIRHGDGPWQTFHTDYLVVVERMAKMLEPPKGECDERSQ